MANQLDVVVPDLGEFSDVPVIELLVAPGATVSLEDPLITLESDKATMDIPAPMAGVVADILVNVGDVVNPGDVVMRLTIEEPSVNKQPTTNSPPPTAPAAPDSSEGEEFDVIVPDLGEFADIPVIEILVSAGDKVNQEDSLVTVESDKATMDIPAPTAGEVRAVTVQVGDTVSTGDVIARMVATTADTQSGVATVQPNAPEPMAPTNPEPHDDGAPADPAASAPDPRAPSTHARRASPTASIPSSPDRRGAGFHATPAIRRFARTLGVDLGEVTGTGRKGRILADDVTAFVKGRMSGTGTSAPSSGAGIPPIPDIDFSRFGPTEVRPLSRIKRLTGVNLHRAWLNVPLVTHHDEADATELEAFRKSLKSDPAVGEARVTLLAFIFKALANALKEFPTFNSSLTPDGESLVLKQYCHLGMAVDTPNGLVVPVLRDVDRKGVVDLALEMSEVSARARDGKLKLTDLEGASMSVSSLGGIGGTSFTPLVNAPEVAILGVSRTKMAPVWDGAAFVPRLMLPLSLSYDHRVIDGAEGARFTAYLCQLLNDVRRLLL